MVEENAKDINETIKSMLAEGRKFPPSDEFRKKANIKSLEEYLELYERSVSDPEKFWGDMAEELHWFKKWKKVISWDPPFAKWFEGGRINVSYNCLDRHLSTWRKNKAAIIWEGEPGDSRIFTYHQLHREVCKFANVLKKFDVTKGDRVCLYMPMLPELAIAMLACTRIGAVHSIVFGGFSADALRDRIRDSEAKLVVTCDGSFRRGKRIPLKSNTDRALEFCPSVEKVIVVNRTNLEVRMKGMRDHWWHDVMEHISPACPPEQMDAEDPLFILYTSGTTGKPKGVLHTTAGYLLYVYLTSKWIFDLKEEDTYWCTADIGWVTGHSYIVYGPLANGAASVMFEGVPNYPKPDRFWEVVEKYGINIFYTAPTAIRAIMRDGEKWPNMHDLSSLRLLGSVGEPINPEAWIWYYEVIGKERCPIVDTWWQTETGGILISPLPGAMELKPGCASRPFPGVVPAVLREDGSEVEKNEGGYLVIKEPWPGMLRTLYGDPERFKEQYFSKYPKYYFTGDGARIDEDGDYWLMGRIDDVINVSGHRIGTMEVESALVSHDVVAEAAVVPMPHEIKGQGLYAFVTLREGVEKSGDLQNLLRAHVAKEIGPIAKPDKIQFADALPKTRSGKILRRILKVIASGKDDCGDTSTLADPKVVDTLLEERV
ncbi:MAG: acetate--CoA ligase [Methanomassiliicoccales archaeon]|nr:MAG: acetate--CoA ligase [Methanomassiliicoccales archaeon]